MKSSPLKLVSGYKPEECLIRISEEICLREPHGFSIPDWPPKKPVAGYIHSNSFVIWKSFPINSYRPILSCRVNPLNFGTIIEGRFSISPYVRIICYLQSITAVFIISIIALAMYSQYLKYHKIEMELIFALFFMLGLIIIFFIFCFYLRRIAHKEPQFLKEYLIDILNAAEYNLEKN